MVYLFTSSALAQTCLILEAVPHLLGLWPAAQQAYACIATINVSQSGLLLLHGTSWSSKRMHSDMLLASTDQDDPSWTPFFVVVDDTAAALGGIWSVLLCVDPPQHHEALLMPDGKHQLHGWIQKAMARGFACGSAWLTQSSIHLYSTSQDLYQHCPQIVLKGSCGWSGQFLRG